MKKTKKTMALLLSTLLTFGAAGNLIACDGGGGGGNPAQQVDGETIVVKVRRAGFGTDWLYELKGKFETAYAEEGYKVLIMTPDNAIQGGVLMNELAMGYEKTNVDLYIGTGVTPNQVGVANVYDKILAEDLEEIVYNQKAIAYDGTEETQTVREKLGEDVLSHMSDSAGDILDITKRERYAY